jgi:hypothetical protein
LRGRERGRVLKETLKSIKLIKLTVIETIYHLSFRSLHTMRFFILNCMFSKALCGLLTYRSLLVSMSLWIPLRMDSNRSSVSLLIDSDMPLQRWTQSRETHTSCDPIQRVLSVLREYFDQALVEPNEFVADIDALSWARSGMNQKRMILVWTECLQ